MAPEGEAPVPESPPSIIILDDDEGMVAPEEQPAEVPGGGQEAAPEEGEPLASAGLGSGGAPSGSSAPAPGGEASEPGSSIVILGDEEGGDEPGPSSRARSPTPREGMGETPERGDVAVGRGPGEWDTMEAVPSRPDWVTLRRSGPFGRTRVPARLTPAWSRPREGASGGVYFLAPEDSAEPAEGYGSGWVVREGFPGREVGPTLERRRNYARELAREGGLPYQERAEGWEWGRADAVPGAGLAREP